MPRDESTPTELETATTRDLFNEIRRRYPVAILIINVEGREDLKDDETQVEMHLSTMSIYECVGVLEWASGTMKAKLFDTPRSNT